MSGERAQRGEPVLMFERDRPSRFGIVRRFGDMGQKTRYSYTGRMKKETRELGVRS